MGTKENFDVKLKTTLLVKSDRIVKRIADIRRTNKKENLTKKDLDSILKSIEILIAQELNDKGNTRDLRAIYFYSGKAKDMKIGTTSIC